MRGKLTPGGYPLGAGGNIPAYAGKTDPLFMPDVLRAEHPRVCGENHLESHTRQAWRGTSPRMRGKPCAVVRQGLGRRNIPAYAGKTAGACSITHAMAEHPRVCGENGGRFT